MMMSLIRIGAEICADSRFGGNESEVAVARGRVGAETRK